MRCPICGFQKFYVKDPEDEYEIHHFCVEDGSVCFEPDADTSKLPVVSPDMEIFCDQCAWHGKFNTLNIL